LKERICFMLSLEFSSLLWVTAAFERIRRNYLRGEARDLQFSNPRPLKDNLPIVSRQDYFEIIIFVRGRRMPRYVRWEGSDLNLRSPFLGVVFHSWISTRDQTRNAYPPSAVLSTPLISQWWMYPLPRLYSRLLDALTCPRICIQLDLIGCRSSK
jgi:hypothetical protein